MTGKTFEELKTEMLGKYEKLDDAYCAAYTVDVYGELGREMLGKYDHPNDACQAAYTVHEFGELAREMLGKYEDKWFGYVKAKEEHPFF